MKIFEYFADRIIASAATREVYFHLDGYMQRWWLKKPRNQGVQQGQGWGARLHHILRGDAERDLHDHPYASISIVLRGGYWEVMPWRQDQPTIVDTCFGGVHRVWRGPGAIVFRRATDRHRIDIPAGRDSWSVFIMFPWSREWGFYTQLGWVPWKLYVERQRTKS